MSVTMAEFTQNPQKYIYLSETEDVIITEAGRFVTMLTTRRPNPEQRTARNPHDIEKLFGILPATRTWDEVKEERLKDYESLT